MRLSVRSWPAACGLCLVTGIRQQQLELPHVPRGRRAPLGAQPAVQAHVLVLHHDALRLRQVGRDVDVLRQVHRGRREPRAQVASPRRPA